MFHILFHCSSKYVQWKKFYLSGRIIGCIELNSCYHNEWFRVFSDISRDSFRILDLCFFVFQSNIIFLFFIRIIFQNFFIHYSRFCWDLYFCFFNGTSFENSHQKVNTCWILQFYSWIQIKLYYLATLFFLMIQNPNKQYYRRNFR